MTRAGGHLSDHSYRQASLAEPPTRENRLGPPWQSQWAGGPDIIREVGKGRRGERKVGRRHSKAWEAHVGGSHGRVGVMQRQEGCEAFSQIRGSSDFQRELHLRGSCGRWLLRGEGGSVGRHRSGWAFVPTLWDGRRSMTGHDLVRREVRQATLTHRPRTSPI